jgi:hypothetical protein
MVESPTPYTHYRAPADGPVEPGIYRVVGRDDDSVTLLRVADSDGRRAVTGEVTAVDRSRLGEFESADDPDRGFRPWEIVDGFVQELRMVWDWVGRLAGRLVGRR